MLLATVITTPCLLVLRLKPDQCTRPQQVVVSVQDEPFLRASVVVTKQPTLLGDVIITETDTS